MDLSDVEMRIKPEIKRFAVKVGVTPDEALDIYIPLIAENVKSFFPDFSIQELRNAFDLGLSGRLGIDDIKAYGLIDVLYVNKFLIAYREYRSKEIQKEQQNGTLDFNQTRVMTEDEKNQITIDFILEAYEHFKEHNEMKYPTEEDYVSQFHYDFLRQQGLMSKPSKEESEKLKKHCLELYNKKFKDKLSRAENGKEAKQITNQFKSISKQSKRDSIYTMCKAELVKQFFMDCVMEDVDLSEQLKTLN